MQGEEPHVRRQAPASAKKRRQRSESAVECGAGNAKAQLSSATLGSAKKKPTDLNSFRLDRGGMWKATLQGDLECNVSRGIPDNHLVGGQGEPNSRQEALQGHEGAGSQRLEAQDHDIIGGSPPAP